MFKRAFHGFKRVLHVLRLFQGWILGFSSLSSLCQEGFQGCFKGGSCMFMFIGCLEIVLLVILVCPEGVSGHTRQ